MDRETAEEIKRHFSVVSEGLRSEIRTVGEAQIGTNERLDRIEARMSEEFSEVRAMIRLSFGELDRRIRSLESDLSSLRARLERVEGRLGG